MLDVSQYTASRKMRELERFTFRLRTQPKCEARLYRPQALLRMQPKREALSNGIHRLWR
jgi:hypothetical protein